jgi:LysR family transcriptional regulator, flagellar master operon regulator
VPFTLSPIVQMCHDVAKGALDFALVFSPQPLPDLFFTTAGEVTYQLVSSDCTLRADLKPDRYIRASYAPAFETTHSQTLPEMSATPLASGQDAAVGSLLETLGGAGFVLESTAARLIASGKFSAVTDVTPITQPYYAVMHHRHRTQRLHRRLVRTVQKHMPG